MQIILFAQMMKISFDEEKNISLQFVKTAVRSPSPQSARRQSMARVALYESVQLAVGSRVMMVSGNQATSLLSAQHTPNEYDT